MGRRRGNAAPRDAAGVYHVASRLAFEGFSATVALGSGAGTDVLAGLPGRSAAAALAALAARTAACPPGFGGGEGGGGRSCEWRVGKGVALADDPGPFVALVDLKRPGEPPGVWVVPSAKVRARVASAGDPRPYRYRASGEELAPHAEDWDALGDHLARNPTPRTGWVDRRELADLYGDEFVEELDIEASRLLGAQGSTIREMADKRFPAEELAQASALLRVLFRRRTAEERERKLEERRRGRA